MWGAIAGAAVQGLSMLGQKKKEQRAMDNQVKLMDIQTNNQMALNKQGSDLQYEMWEKTNYPAQIKMMKEAGVNPALMYGGGGAGGTTTGSQSGGSASGGNAPAPQPMDIAAAAQVAAQTELLKAQKENIKADTANKTSNTEGQSLENKLKEAGIDSKIIAEVLKAENDMKKAKSDIHVDQGDEGNKWSDGSTKTNYEEGRLADLKERKLKPLLTDAQTALQKATASNLISNDELVQLQTDLMSAQMGIINSESFKKLPMEVQGLLLMVIKKLGGL